MSKESSWDLSLGDILLRSICVTHIQKTPTQCNTDRSEKLTVIDIVCITNICVTDSCSPFMSHYMLPATLVTTTEWLSPWYNDCCYDRRGEEELLPLRLSRWMRKSHQPGAVERERERFSIALIFPHFSRGFVWFIFEQHRKPQNCVVSR